MTTPPASGLDPPPPGRVGGRHPIAVTIAATTDIGLQRERNEDALLLGDLSSGVRGDVEDPYWTVASARGPLLAVCDGMGGVEGGEVAAELAVHTLWAEMLASAATDDAEVYARMLRRAVRAANRRVYEEGRRHSGLRGMGTTLSACGFAAGDRAVLAQVGDSRAYVLRAGVLTQVTRDQSLASALRASGLDNVDDDEHGAILQAVGVGPDVLPSLSLVRVCRGDLLILCSDGVHGVLDDATLAELLVDAEAPLADRLERVRLAIRAYGAPDNATVVAAALGGAGLAPPRGPEDQPEFAEFDPAEEGQRALTSTSLVVRRLAVRVGIPAPSDEARLPVTGQHTALLATRPPRPRVLVAHEGAAVPTRSPPGRAWWLGWGVAAVVVAVVAWVLAGGL